MKRIPFIFLCLLFLAGCASSKQYSVNNMTIDIYENVYRIEVINNSEHQAMTIMCLVNLLDKKEKCLTGAVPLYPENFKHKNGMILPSTVNMNLRAGDYLFFVNNMSLLTGKTTQLKIPVQVYEDGQIFLVPKEE